MNSIKSTIWKNILILGVIGGILLPLSSFAEIQNVKTGFFDKTKPPVYNTVKNPVIETKIIPKVIPMNENCIYKIGDKITCNQWKQTINEQSEVILLKVYEDVKIDKIFSFSFKDNNWVIVNVPSYDLKKYFVIAHSFQDREYSTRNWWIGVVPAFYDWMIYLKDNSELIWKELTFNSYRYLRPEKLVKYNQKTRDLDVFATYDDGGIIPPDIKRPYFYPEAPENPNPNDVLPLRLKEKDTPYESSIKKMALGFPVFSPETKRKITNESQQLVDLKISKMGSWEVLPYLKDVINRLDNVLLWVKASPELKAKLYILRCIVSDAINIKEVASMSYLDQLDLFMRQEDISKERNYFPH